MKKQPAQKKYASTQRFTEITDIKENIVLFSQGYASLVIEVKATNFSLLSEEEQKSKMGSYASLLNSLSFPIQILVENKKLDISSYLKLLEQASASSSNTKLSEHLASYQTFVAELVKKNVVLDKKFYIAISYSSFEGTDAKTILSSKAESLHAQLKSMNLSAKTLSKDELVSLFSQRYNGDSAHGNPGKDSPLDIIAPSSIEVDFSSIRVGERFYKTLFVVGYPRFVSPNWLSPLIDFDHSLDISFFIYPSSSSDTITTIRRKIGEMEATLSSQEKEGQVPDAKTQAGLEDALTLQEELAKGTERFFQMGLYITIAADSQAELNETSKRLHSTLSSILVTAKTATLQMEEGFKSTLPMGLDKLFIPRNMDTTS